MTGSIPSKTFFTDDEGVYVLDNRDAPASAERQDDGSLDLDAVLASVRKRIRKVGTVAWRFRRSLLSWSRTIPG